MRTGVCTDWGIRLVLGVSMSAPTPSCRCGWDFLYALLWCCWCAGMCASPGGEYGILVVNNILHVIRLELAASVCCSGTDTLVCVVVLEDMVEWCVRVRYDSL